MCDPLPTPHREGPTASPSTHAYFEGIGLYDNVNAKILELYAGETSILDIGCGSGALGKHLKALHRGVVVYGIDRCDEAAAVAERSLDRFFRLDLDREPIPALDRHFDLIILGDILEHLARPDLLLRSLKDHLTPVQGRLIISVPNVAQVRIRRRLLMGHFDYTDTGILDRTHLRFFTYRTICDLLETCGYRIEARRFISGRWRRWERWFYRLVAIQFVFKVKAQ